MRWTLLLSFALIAVSRPTVQGVQGRGRGRWVAGTRDWTRLFSVDGGGEWFVCSCWPFGGGLQTNRVLLFDSARPCTPPFRDLGPTFWMCIPRPRITTNPRLFRVHSSIDRRETEDRWSVRVAIVFSRRGNFIYIGYHAFDFDFEKQVGTIFLFDLNTNTRERMINIVLLLTIESRRWSRMER